MEPSDINHEKRKNNEILRFCGYDLFSDQTNYAFTRLRIWDDYVFNFNENLLCRMRLLYSLSMNLNCPSLPSEYTLTQSQLNSEVFTPWTEYGNSVQRVYPIL